MSGRCESCGVSMSGWRHALSWFPGHAKKASRDMAERLKHVDIVLEIRDARVRIAAPFGRGNLATDLLPNACCCRPQEAHQARSWRNWCARQVDQIAMPSLSTRSTSCLRRSATRSQNGCRRTIRASLSSSRAPSPRQGPAATALGRGSFSTQRLPGCA